MMEFIRTTTPQEDSIMVSTRAPRAPISAWSATIALSLAVSFGAAALIARFLYPESFAVAFWVFGLSVLGPVGALLWVLLISRYTVKADLHADQGVEVSWLHRAGFGALTDVFVLAGVGSAVVALSGLPLTGVAALMGTAAFAALSLGVRYQVLRRKNA
ncbi:hypothetical protein V1639_09370 [Pseudarthrobacter sp. J75]|uniref:hypothetical protein n=1 Tax=unclassified Pseudarthrobacter TaxID=2647000 RepID=UPI002E81CC23|nr:MULTISPECIES: hypothetical protein [unclassified Pseudarthrobacter]MEE2522434.1 hypothetical protein [Pseudarthrobacter sp. J47]MEE2529235.1 hypothetical protein [Pseudarthrobacter sp. J75]